MVLSEAKEGDNLVVTGSTNESVTIQAIRFGIDAGALIKVEKKIPGGPVIISKNQLEIAIGRQLATAISVELHANL